jgi:hypothetical protein
MLAGYFSACILASFNNRHLVKRNYVWEIDRILWGRVKHLDIMLD